MVFKRYPRLFLAILCISLFTLGFFRERAFERQRLHNLLESSAQADHNFQKLQTAYELRLRTAHTFVELALKHKVVVPSNLVLTLDSLDAQTSVDNVRAMTDYEAKQVQLASALADLITAMDVELSPGSTEFSSLFRQYRAQEQELSQIQADYHQQSRRVRALARKGDRKFLSPGMRLPSAVEENL